MLPADVDEDDGDVVGSAGIQCLLEEIVCGASRCEAQRHRLGRVRVVDDPQRPSEHSSHRSPGCVGMMKVSSSGSASMSPSTRISTDRRGWNRASSGVMRPESTRRCTNVWSVVIWVRASSRNR